MADDFGPVTSGFAQLQSTLSLDAGAESFAPGVGSLFGVSGDLAGAPVIWASGEDPVRDVYGSAYGPVFPLVSPGTPGDIRTVEKSLADFYQSDPGDLAKLQEALYGAGLYSSSYYNENGPRPNLGVPDEDSFAAWKTLVIRAARAKKPIRDMLMDAQKAFATAGAGRGAGGGGSRQIRSYSLSDPATLRKIAEEVGQEVYGRAPDPKLVAQFIAKRHGEEKSAQAVNYTGGTAIQPGDPRASLEEQLRAAVPAEAEAHDAARLFEGFLSMIGGDGA